MTDRSDRSRRHPLDAAHTRPHTRRDFLRYGGSLGLAAAGLSSGALWRAAARGGRDPCARPTACPTRSVPAGTVNEAMPFDHIVVIMMENHSFDNVARRARALAGQPKAHGLRFSPAGVALNSNPGPNGPVRSFPFADAPRRAERARRAGTRPTRRSTAAGWTGSCARSKTTQPMGYWTPGGAAVRLLAGEHVLRRQPLVLLGALPDLPEPPLPDGRHGLREHLDRHRKPQRSAAAERHDLGPAARVRDQLDATTSPTCRPRRSSRRRSRSTRRTSRRSRSSTPTAPPARCRR